MMCSLRFSQVGLIMHDVKNSRFPKRKKCPNFQTVHKHSIYSSIKNNVFKELGDLAALLQSELNNKNKNVFVNTAIHFLPLYSKFCPILQLCPIMFSIFLMMILLTFMLTMMIQRVILSLIHLRIRFK